MYPIEKLEEAENLAKWARRYIYLSIVCDIVGIVLLLTNGFEAWLFMFLVGWLTACVSTYYIRKAKKIIESIDI